jgi:hypothetical protein
LLLSLNGINPEKDREDTQKNPIKKEEKNLMLGKEELDKNPLISYI